MSVALYLAMPLSLLALPDESGAGRTVSTAEVRKVVAAIVAAAEENAARREDRRSGDALADYYVRRAVQTPGVPARAVLVGLGVALDHTDFLRHNPLIRPQLTRWETDAERQRRLQVIGRPSLRGREDWSLHFAISAALTAYLGAEQAERCGLAKEMLDAHGPSGFSFADLAADYAGIALAEMLLSGDDSGAKRRALADRFKGDAYLPRIDDLEDGLTLAQFTEKYGGPRDPRFLDHCKAVRERVRQAPGLREGK